MGNNENCELLHQFIDQHEAFQLAKEAYEFAKNEIKGLIPEGSEMIITHEGEYFLFKRQRGGALQISKPKTEPVRDHL